MKHETNQMLAIAAIIVVAIIAATIIIVKVIDTQQSVNTSRSAVQREL